MGSKITTSQSETSFGELLSNNRQFSIPPFQRPYSWKKKNFIQLFDDLVGISEGQEDVHFMGAIIMDRRLGGTTDLDTYEVIDGQQRITTIYLTVCAAVSVLLRYQKLDEASALASKYLLVSNNGYFMPKVSPSMPDRHDLNQILGSLFNEGLEKAPHLKVYPLRKLSSLGEREAQISKTYSEIKRKFKQFASESSIEGVLALTEIALSNLSAVEIVVQDPSAGPKIFDSLNSRQEPITTGDLVRNEIFGRVARDNPAEAIRLDEELWTPFYASFAQAGDNSQRDHFEKFFFPAGLLINSSLKKNEVFPELRHRWKDWSVEKVMTELNESRVPYQDLAFGLNKSGFGKSLADGVMNLHLMSLPAAAYPFVMKVLQEVQKGNLPEESATDVLHEVESFLVRRAICSIEPTGLHAVFKGLWSALKGEITGPRVKAHLCNIKTVEYPSDEKVTRHLKEPLYGKGIAKYFVWSYDKSLGGDIHGKDDFYHRCWIEHVLPQTLPKSGWEAFAPKVHSELVHQVGNLIPLTEVMNIDVGQLPYHEKKSKISEKSKYISARTLTMENQDWTPDKLTKRTEGISRWALSRWS